MFKCCKRILPMFTVSQVQRATAAEKQEPKTLSLASAPATEIPASISMIEAGLKIGHGSKDGMEAEKVIISEQQGRSAVTMTTALPMIYII